MKSQVNVLLHVVQGIFRDVSAAYPALKGIDLDNKRIALYCRFRGLSLFTLDLPALETLLLKGLETGRLDLSGPLSRAVSKKTRVPRLFSGLWLRVFDKSACLKLDADPTAITFLRQLMVIGKKLEVECSADRRKAVLENYHDVERSLLRPTLAWSNDTIDVRRLNDINLYDCVANDVPLELFPEQSVQADKTIEDNDVHLLTRCQQVADILSEDLGFFEPVTYSGTKFADSQGLGFKHGPGAVAERYKNHEKSLFPYWPRKLEHWFPFVDCAHVPTDDRTRPLNHEVPSRLICVPKTAKGPRLIAAEPIAHQWCQQVIWDMLRSRLKTTVFGAFINFRRQDLSGDLVLKASRNRKLATVDLSDASDRLSCWTVERIFRRNASLVSCLHAARTRYLRDDLSEDMSSFVRLKKFASQGTATTFPVQSLVFLTIALASCHSHGSITRDSIRSLRGRVRVFGDDIIIPRHGYARLCRTMTLLQLKVNEAKSYVHGHFRESCGTDGYQGYDVTPVKPRFIVADSPQSTQGVIDVANNLFLKGFWHASSHLLSTIPNRVLSATRIVHNVDCGFSGLPSFSGSDESHLVKRWNPKLQRYEGRVWALVSKNRTKPREGYAVLLDFFSRPHCSASARAVSDYSVSRKVGSTLRWEPLNMGDTRYNVPQPSKMGVFHYVR